VGKLASPGLSFSGLFVFIWQIFLERSRFSLKEQLLDGPFIVGAGASPKVMAKKIGKLRVFHKSEGAEKVEDPLIEKEREREGGGKVSNLALGRRNRLLVVGRDLRLRKGRKEQSAHVTVWCSLVFRGAL
jgi:hypothetical protein